jgi:hypothetical protein
VKLLNRPDTLSTSQAEDSRLQTSAIPMEAGSTSVTIGPEDARELREACKNISRIGHIENAK